MLSSYQRFLQRVLIRVRPNVLAAWLKPLLGSPKVFEQHRVKALALELHPTILADRGKASSDIEQMLERCGYRCSMEFGNAVWLAPSA